jgi:hypothetical protein
VDQSRNRLSPTLFLAHRSEVLSVCVRVRVCAWVVGGKEVCEWIYVCVCVVCVVCVPVRV